MAQMWRQLSTKQETMDDAAENNANNPNTLEDTAAGLQIQLLSFLNTSVCYYLLLVAYWTCLPIDLGGGFLARNLEWRLNRSLGRGKMAAIYSFPDQAIFLDETSKDGRDAIDRYARSKRGTLAVVKLPFSVGNYKWHIHQKKFMMLLLKNGPSSQSLAIAKVHLTSQTSP